MLDDILDLAVYRVQGQGRGAGHFTMWTHEFKPMLGVRAKATADIPTASIRIARKDLRRVLVEAASASAEIRWGTAVRNSWNHFLIILATFRAQKPLFSIIECSEASETVRITLQMAITDPECCSVRRLSGLIMGDFGSGS